MFFNSNVGVDVKGTNTIQEALEVAGLNWKVDAKDVIVDGNVINGIKANMTDQNKFLGIVSDQYKIVQNTEAFSFADTLIGQIELIAAGSLFDDKKIWLSAKLNDVDLAGQKFENFLIFTNSHDGHSSIRAAIIPISPNGAPLNLPLNRKRNWSIPHYGNIEKKMEEAQETIKLSEDYLAELVLQTEKLVNTKLTTKQLDAFLELLFPITPQDGDRKIDNINELRSSVRTSIEKIDSHKGTAWQVINGVSNYISNAEARRASDSFEKNKFHSIICGSPVIDNAYRILKLNYIK